MELITSLEEAVSQVHAFNKKCEKFAELLPYYRAWYALSTKDGWILGPSKFIGYKLTPEEYLGTPYSAERRGRSQTGKSGTPMDGRVTEAVLRRWSDLIEEGHPEYDSLHTALNGLCARYGKKPNTKARISVIRKESNATKAAEFGDEFVDLMLAVYRQLSPAQKSVFRKKIA